ncbi:MAG: asparagine synthase (glutamine-hydrolyzing) [Alphaproteobacteria bacterium]|nr:asparagine synthase (glutamine-hydrolyzing) [Alphaproteobacteria bacterium]
MCGFVAVIGPGAPLPEALLSHMRDQLAHRGPDGAANWQGTHANGTVAMGFRRLAIIDTRQVADQPMVSADGRYTIVFNGEIYNYIELRDELIARGHAFQTRSDTEVLLCAYIEWGEEMIHRLNGMFAFMIWDQEHGEALIARDRFGEKPLYYAQLPDGKLVFASEIKAILAHPDMPMSYDKTLMGRVVDGHIIFGKEETLFQGVKQLRAAHMLRVGADGAIRATRRYWKPEYTQSLNDVPKSQLIEELRHHLERSLHMRMRSDVPVTACLSGGLDSSSIVGLLAGFPKGERIESAISVRFPDDPTIDEGSYIDQMLNATHLKGHAVTPTSNDLITDLRKLHWHHENIIPGPSMYLEWALMREARSLGYKVILDGQGADEVFAGYSMYFKAYQAELAHRGPLGLLNAIRQGHIRDKRLQDVAKNYHDASRRFSTRDSLSVKRFFTYYRTYAPEMLLQYGDGMVPHPHEIGALRYELMINLLRTSLPSNLYSGDRNSMAHGIECRYPFLDYALVDFTTRLPDWAFQDNAWGKAILRYAVDDVLPKTITWRADKVGFAAPQDAWLKAPAMKQWMEERIFDAGLAFLPNYNRTTIENMWRDHQSGTADYSLPLWKWASASELLDMKRTNVWSKKTATNAAIIEAPKPTAWIISYTPVCKEPRVIRQAQALMEAGWRVVVMGLMGKTNVPDGWHFVPLPDELPMEDAQRMHKWFGERIGGRAFSYFTRALGRLRIVGMFVARFAPTHAARLIGARFYQRVVQPFEWKRRAIRNYFYRHPDMQPQLVLTHDYFTADIGIAIAKKVNAPVIVDCHEYACGQYVHIPNWVKWHRPYVFALQDYYLKKVQGVTTVCQGIAELIRKDHKLQCPVQVVRSTPFFEPQNFKPTEDTITVLYHGEIFSSRGLHVAVRSLQYWRPEFRLLLRGNPDVGYLDELKAIAKEVGVEDRLFIEPAVPFNDIIPAANRADIGYFVHEDLSAQRRFTLPNKFFEYVMAGLALCVSDLPEMARLVKQYEVGQLVSDCDPKAVAEVINRFDRPMIDAMKQRSIEAAKTLNWETEKQHMLKLYESVRT